MTITTSVATCGCCNVLPGIPECPCYGTGTGSDSGGLPSTMNAELNVGGFASMDCPCLVFAGPFSAPQNFTITWDASFVVPSFGIVGAWVYSASCGTYGTFKIIVYCQAGLGFAAMLYYTDGLGAGVPAQIDLGNPAKVDNDTNTCYPVYIFLQQVFPKLWGSGIPPCTAGLGPQNAGLTLTLTA